jgi:cell division protein FtsB
MAYRGAQKEKVPALRGRRQRKGLAFRVVRWLMVGIVCVVVGKWAFSFGENVMMLAREAHEQRQAIAALREEADRLSQQNAALREEIRKLHTASGVILEARKQGYGFPGERLLVVEPAPGQSSTAR